MIWMLLSVLGIIGVGILVGQRNPVISKKKEIRYFRIVPHAETKLDHAAIIRLAEQFAGYSRSKRERARKGREWFRYMAYMDSEGKINLFFGFPQDRQTGVKKTFQTIYPECELHEAKDVPLPTKKKRGYGGYFIPEQKGDMEGLPFKKFDGKDDEWADVLHFLETETWIDLVFSPTTQWELSRLVRRTQRTIKPLQHSRSELDGLVKFGLDVLNEFNPNRKSAYKSVQKPVSADLDPERKARYQSLFQRFTGREGVVNVRLAIWSQNPYANSVVQSIATSISAMMSQNNGLVFRRKRINPINSLDPTPYPNQTMIWTTYELANILHIPNGGHTIYSEGLILHLQRGQRSLKKGELSTGIRVGTLDLPFQEKRPVHIPVGQFTRHFVLTGKTGAGKTSTAVEVVQSIIDQWLENPNKAPGFSYLDPAGETLLIILTRLLKAELDGKKVPWEKVHYSYLGPTEYPIGLNLLHRNPGESIGEVADTALSLLKFAYSGDTPRMDRLLKNAMMTLLADKRPHTILGIVPVLTDESFRNRILPNVQDPIVQRFWLREIDPNGIDPIENRLSALLTNETMRRMFGQKKWSLKIRKYMDEGHIYLWDLLNVSESNVRLSMGHLINQYHVTAKQRPAQISRPHIVLVDEAHLVQLPVMSKIIAEDRKFGLVLGLITQYIGQFNPELVQAISENVGTIMSCTQGPTSATALQAMTAGSFTKEYLQNLPERVVAVYTQTENEETGLREKVTFTVQSDPPFMYLPTGKIADHKNNYEVIQATEWAKAKAIELQKRDGTHISIVDQEIADYLRIKTVHQEMESLKVEDEMETGRAIDEAVPKKGQKIRVEIPQ